MEYKDKLEGSRRSRRKCSRLNRVRDEGRKKRKHLKLCVHVQLGLKEICVGQP
jgi:hypothetical protein